MRRPALHTILLIGATLLLGASALAGGINRVGRVPPPFTTQAANVPGRTTALSDVGVRTTHALRTQGQAIEGVIARGGLKDPLVMHRAAMAEVRLGPEALRRAASAEVELVRLRGQSFEFLLPVKGKSLTQSTDAMLPELGAWMQTNVLAPSRASVVDGKWFLELGGKSVPLRPPMIRRTGREGAI